MFLVEHVCCISVLIYFPSCMYTCTCTQRVVVACVCVIKHMAVNSGVLTCWFIQRRVNSAAVVAGHPESVVNRVEVIMFMLQVNKAERQFPDTL